MYDSGARVQELITLNVCAVNFNNKTVDLYGKGRKNRTIPLLKQTIKILEKYIKVYSINLNSNSLLFFNFSFIFLNIGVQPIIAIINKTKWVEIR